MEISQHFLIKNQYLNYLHIPFNVSSFVAVCIHCLSNNLYCSLVLPFHLLHSSLITLCISCVPRVLLSSVMYCPFVIYLYIILYIYSTSTYFDIICTLVHYIIIIIVMFNGINTITVK